MFSTKCLIFLTKTLSIFDVHFIEQFFDYDASCYYSFHKLRVVKNESQPAYPAVMLEVVTVAAADKAGVLHV